MAGSKTAKTGTQRSAKSTASATKKFKGFSAEERAAMKARAEELKAEAAGADAESAVLAKIAEMPEPDRAMAERFQAIIKASAPALSPKLWYGMPAYAKDGKVVCFFQSAQKFKTRYSSFGFSDKANLDEGNMWPTGFALKGLTAAPAPSGPSSTRHRGIRVRVLQQPDPCPGQRLRSPQQDHRGQGWQPAQRGPDPVQLHDEQRWNHGCRQDDQPEPDHISAAASGRR